MRRSIAASGPIEETAQPGTDGNAGIAGHRDGFFRGLKDIAEGDAIELQTLGGRDAYRVERIWIVEPDDVSVLDPTPVAVADSRHLLSVLLRRFRAAAIHRSSRERAQRPIGKEGQPIQTNAAPSLRSWPLNYTQTGEEFMSSTIRRTLLSVAALACLIGIASAQTTTTKSETKKFEIIAVDGNQLVVRGPDGTREITVPADFRFTVDGKPLTVQQLKPGMAGTATISTRPP